MNQEMNPFAMNESGWIHEESSLFGRCCSWILPGCHAVEYVQHSDSLSFGDVIFPICNCFPLHYLETKRSDDTSVGKTLYICDACCFVPKFDVFDENGHRKYRIKPDTCVLGMCVMCRCGQMLPYSIYCS